MNVANLGRKPYRSLAADVVHILQDELKLLLRGEVVWRKGEGAAGNCAWGSFRSAANPVLRDITERVVIASKGRFDRALGRRRTRAPRAAVGRTRSTPTSSWPPRSTCGTSSPRARAASRIRRRFPVELPERLIDLYTYENDLVLDPFMGSGSTLVAAARLGRRYVGYDLDPTYVDIARLRVRDEGSTAVAPVVAPRRRRPTEPTTTADNFQARASKEGKAAQALAEELLDEHRLRDRRQEPTRPRHRRDDQLHRQGRRRRRVVLRRVGRVHEHARRAAAHRHRVEDARARARAARRAVQGPDSCSSRRTCRARAARATSRCRTSPSRAASSTRSRCARPRATSGCASTRRAGTPRCRSPASST